MSETSGRRIFIAGAGGTLGLPLARQLVLAGHKVTGLTRSAQKRGQIEAAGARAVVADALDAEGVVCAVREAEPTQVVNLLTALPAPGALRPSDLRATNRLRIHGSANLLRAAIEVRSSRVVAESFVAVYGRSKMQKVLNEEDPMGDAPANDPLCETILALRLLEDQHAEAREKGQIETVVLRYGFFYGPNVASTESLLRRLRAGRMFFPRGTGGAASWIHIEDAVSATIAVLGHPAPSAVYHVVDDEPMTMEKALREACQAFGAPEPRSLPAWILRWAAPVVASMTSAHLALDNGKAQQELNWRPAYPTLREGYADLARRSGRAA